MNCVCRIWIVTLVGFGLLTSQASGDLVTIDFDSFTPTTNFPGGVEEDYVIGSLSGPVAVSNQYMGAFSGINSIHHQSPGTAVFEITHQLGSKFELVNFRAGSTFGSLVQFTVSGFADGALIGSDTYTPTLDTYTLLSAPSLAGIQLDRVVFNLGNAQIGPTHIDDIVVNTVPEPSATLLGLFATMTLMCRRRYRTR